MEDWKKIAIRACELKRVLDSMEEEYNGLRKKIQEIWETQGVTTGEVETSQGHIKVRLDERTRLEFDNEAVLDKIGRSRFLRIASVSQEKFKQAINLGLITTAELEDTYRENTSRSITLRCP